jgi:hypothetical protein
MITQVYSSLWNKYRPAIIQLMLASQESPQKYKLFDHEFKALNAKEKNYSFQFQVFQGKAKSSIKTSVVAQDLLSMLNLSRKASELMEEGTFEFALDKKFMLHVSRSVAVVEPEPAPTL